MESERLTNIGAWAWTVSSNITTLFEELYRILGYDPVLAASVFKKHPQVIAAESWAKLKAAADESLRSGLPFEVNLELIRLDGSKRCVAVHGEVNLDASGQVDGMRGIVEDITERREIDDSLRETSALFESLFESSPDALVLVNANGQIALANRQTEKIFGYVRSELIGQAIECLIPERLRGRHISHRAGYQENPHMRPMGVGLDLRGLHRNGKEFPVDIMLSPLPSATGMRTLAVVRDMTERKAMLDSLFEEKERSHVTLNSIGDAVLSTDNSGRIVYLNKSAERMTGWPLADAIGQPFASVFSIIEGETRKAAQTPVELAILEDAPLNMNTNSILVRRDGAEVPIEDSIAPIHDAAGKIAGTVIVFHDVSKSREMTLQMAYMAQHDFLTNLPNRALLNDRLAQALVSVARRHTQLALLFLDLDQFKHINDSLGHGIGDQLLQSVAERLKTCVRISDTVSRQGGDEFVVLLPDIDHPDDAAQIAEKILAALSVPYSIATHDLYVSVSIGISLYPDDGQDAETLLKNADVAMYYAKDSGRNNFKFFTRDLNLRSVERQTLESNLRQALERNELLLYFQPKVNLETEAIVGAEVLIRWQHPERGLLCPDQFIPIAEDSGLILPIGRWVLREACRQGRAWQDAGLHPLPIAVNISALEFMGRGFLESVRTVLTDTCFDARYLELELTESVLMQNVRAVAPVLDALKRLGMQLAIDDFGTGYSSLSYLSHFPIDVVKIDQSFVHGILTRSDNVTIVSAVIGMCKGLQCRVIAEGVETKDQASLLRARQCAEAQGYYFGQPMAAEKFARLLETIS